MNNEKYNPAGRSYVPIPADLSEALTSGDICGKEELRELLSCYLARIEDQGDGHFKVIPQEEKNFPHHSDGESSTNGKKWYTRRDSNS